MMPFVGMDGQEFSDTGMEAFVDRDTKGFMNVALKQVKGMTVK